MAITRTQIAKQLLEQGGRVGLRGGGADFGAPERAQERADRGYGDPGGGLAATGAPDQDRIADIRQANITLENLKKDKEEEKVERFRNQTNLFDNVLNYASKFSPVAKFVSNYGPLNTREFVLDKNIMDKFSQEEYGKDFSELSFGQQEDLFGDYQSSRGKGEIDAYGNPTGNDRDGGGQQILPPVLAQAPRTMEQEEELSELGQLLADMSGQRYAFMADGGRIGLKGGGADSMKSDADKEFEAFKKMYMQDSMKRGEKEIKDIYEREKKKLLEKRYGVAVANGGIMSPNLVGGIMDGGIDEMGRQMYGLGKLVKKATRAVKKIAKSPIGKAALVAAGGYYLGGGNLFGLQRAGMTGFSFGNLPGAGLFKKGAIDRLAFNASRTANTGSSLFGNKALLGILGTSALAGLMTKQDEEDDEINLAEARGPRLDIAKIRAKPYEAMGQAYGLYAEGGDVKEPVAKKTLPLLDMDGKEKDYRETGGFVDIGRMEKADDVPARLSKNEFVFTADAVRNAGDGDIDKGAEVMYNMMKNLEAGGDVSEESQGLEGARKMFQTSQRLEEVL